MHRSASGRFFGPFRRPLVDPDGFCRSCSGCVRQRRNPSVLRIDDQGRATSLDDGRAAVPPEIVVSEGEVSALTRAVDLTASGRHLFLFVAVKVRVVGLDALRGIGRHLVLSEERLVGELLRAFQRRDGPEVPDSAEVRVPVQRLPR